MFRQWKTILREAGSHASCRRKGRFVPSLSGSVSCLEDRLVLSGAGHAAPAVHDAVVHHGHTAGASGQQGLAAAVTHAATHHGHTAKAQSHHGLAAAVTPVAVSGSRSSRSGSLATFSITRTSHLGTATVPPAPRLGGTSAPSDFRNLTVVMTSKGIGGARSFSVTTTLPGTTTTGTTTATTPTTTTTISTGGTTITTISQLPFSQLPISQFPSSQLPLSQLSMNQLPLSQQPLSQFPLSQLPLSQL
jgi:hypothetical protein